MGKPGNTITNRISETEETIGPSVVGLNVLTGEQSLLLDLQKKVSDLENQVKELEQRVSELEPVASFGIMPFGGPDISLCKYDYLNDPFLTPELVKKIETSIKICTGPDISPPDPIGEAIRTGTNEPD